MLLTDSTDKGTRTAYSAFKQVTETKKNFSSAINLLVIGSEMQLVFPIAGSLGAARGGPMDRERSTQVKYNIELTDAT